MVGFWHLHGGIIPEVLGLMTRISAKSASNRAKKQKKVQQEEKKDGGFGGRQIGMALSAIKYSGPSVSIDNREGRGEGCKRRGNPLGDGSAAIAIIPLP
jgi:hypothetical protein